MDRQDVLLVPPEITSESETGFRDLVFMARGKKAEAVGKMTRYIQASGIYHGKPVGFVFVWGANDKWERLPEPRMPTPVYRDFGLFMSAGARSDGFLAALAKEYGTKKSVPKMTKYLEVGAVSLKGDPRNPELGPVNLKIFFNDEGGPNYAEAYLNLDLPHSRLVLAEKDHAYRGAIVDSLGGPSK